MATLWHFNLESIPERYTYQLQEWYSRAWDAAGVQHVSISGPDPEPSHINCGQVLDGVRRSTWAMGQIGTFLKIVRAGGVNADDVLFFDDFWHPGIEAIPYLFDVMGHPRPRMYCQLWAQSCDEYDFTRKMRPWMIKYEQANGRLFDGIFVANTLLKELVVQDHIARVEKVHVVGLPFHSGEVMERMPRTYRDYLDEGPFSRNIRQNKVIYSSRWDTEKNPLFFIEVAKYVKDRMDAHFVVCTSSPKIRSNSPDLVRALCDAEAEGIITVLEGRTKEGYYEELCTAKVQFNCAKQDWVAFTLLEASVAGCWPIYPDFRSFPETFSGKEYMYLYDPGDVADAGGKIIDVLVRNHEWSPRKIKDRSWIHKRHDLTAARQLYHMGLIQDYPGEPYAVC